jgi:hypothetical protein
MMPALAGFAVTFLVTGAILAAVIAADNWWQSRRPTLPARPPADLPTVGGSAGRAGTYPDEWSI